MADGGKTLLKGGRLAEGDNDRVPTAVFPRGRWQSLVRTIPIWLTLTRAMIGGWRRHSFDALGSFDEQVVQRRIVPVLVGASDAELAALTDYARLNQERQIYFARTLLLAYFTVPFTVLAIVAQLSPGSITGWMSAPRGEFGPYASGIGGAIGGVFTAIALVLLNEARARLLVLALEIVAIERRFRASVIEDDRQTPP